MLMLVVGGQPRSGIIQENLSFWALAAAGISSWHARHRLAAVADSGPGEDDIIAMLAVSASADGDY